MSMLDYIDRPDAPPSGRAGNAAIPLGGMMRYAYGDVGDTSSVPLGGMMKYMDEVPGLVNYGDVPGAHIPGAGEFPKTFTNYKGEQTIDPTIKGHITTIGRNTARLKAVGMYEPPEVPKRNIFWRVVGKLSTPIAGIAGAMTEAAQLQKEMPDSLEQLSAESFGRVWNAALKSAKASWNGLQGEDLRFMKDYLVAKGMKDRRGKIDAVDVAGFMLDVAFDPTTYATFGMTAIPKAGKPLTVAMEAWKAGDAAKFIKAAEEAAPYVKELSKLRSAGKISKEAVEAASLGKLAPTMAEQALLRQRTLAFVPKGAASTFYKGYEPALQAAKGLPVVRAFGRALVPGYEVSRTLPHGSATEFKAMLKEYSSLIESVPRGDAAYIAKTFGSFSKAEREALPFLMEKNVKYIDNVLSDPAVPAPMKSKLALAKEAAGNPALQPALKKMDDWFKLKALDMQKSGIPLPTIENYVMHSYLDIAGKKSLADKLGMLFGMADDADVGFASYTGFSPAKPRKYVLGGEEGGKGLIDAIQKGGLTPELDAAKLMFMYSRKQAAAKYGAEFGREVMSRFGVPLEKVSSVGLKGTQLWTSRVYAKQLATIQKVPKEWLGEGHLVPISAEGAQELLSKVPKSAVYQVPDSIAEAANRMLRVVGRNEPATGLEKSFSWFNSLWKRSALGLFGTQSRNMQGILWQNWLQGVGVKDYAEAVSDLFRRSKWAPRLEKVSGLKGIAGESADVAKASSIGAIDREFFEGWQALDRKLHMPIQSRAFGAVQQVNPFSKDFIYLRKVHDLMQNFENIGRLAAYKSARRQGFDPRNAMLKAYEAHFDYNAATGFTDFENKRMRAIFPFYSWARNNVPYQVKMMFERPGRYAVSGKALKQMEMAGTETREEREYRRPYMTNILATPLPKGFQEWLQEKLRPFGLTHRGTTYWNPNLPFQDIARWGGGDAWNEIVGAAHPLLKHIFEVIPFKAGGMSIDIFTGRRLSQAEYDPAPTWLQFVYNAIPELQHTFKALGAIERRDGTIMMHPLAKKRWETLLPPVMILQRMMPKPEETQDRYAEPGRMADLYISQILSSAAGFKIIYPAVQGEKEARLLRERNRLGQQMGKAEEMGYQFPEFQGERKWIPVNKITETPEQYLQRVRGGF